MDSAAVRTSESASLRQDRATRIMPDALVLAKLIAVARPTPLAAPVAKTALPIRLALVGSMAGSILWWIVGTKLGTWL